MTVCSASPPPRPASSFAMAFSPRMRPRPSHFVIRKNLRRQKSQAPASRHAQRPFPLNLIRRQFKPAIDPSPAPSAPATPPPALSDAVRLANEGRFDEVSTICRAHIEIIGPSPDAYYLLALVSDASQRYEEAATFYRKALYLDPRHRDALAHFCLLAEKLGNTDAAGALRRRALRIEPNAA